MSDRLAQYLQSRLGKSIKMNQKGPGSKSGKLLGMNDEFVVVLTEEDGVTYFPMHHVKALSHNAKTQDDQINDLPEDFKYFNANTFKELLSCLDQVWVHVNHGPEKVEGVISAVDDEWVTIFNHHEVIRVNIYHIKSLSYGNKPAKEEENKDNNKEEQNKKEDKEK